MRPIRAGMIGLLLPLIALAGCAGGATVGDADSIGASQAVAATPTPPPVTVVAQALGARLDAMLAATSAPRPGMAGPTPTTR